MKNNRKLLKICSMLILLLLLAGCASNKSDEVDESTKYEVDGVIFENDLMSITGVSTDEYLQAFKTQEITYTYFAADFKELQTANILNLGGTVIMVAPGENYLEDLECSVLSVFEAEEETIITDKLEEFFICQDSNGNITIYYETYHLYAEQEQGNSIKKYVTLKAYKIEFEYYSFDLVPEVETI